MHYIRFLRPPQATPGWYDDAEDDNAPHEGIVLSLVLAVTTDLSDALLAPARPIPLVADVVLDHDYGGPEPEDGKINELDPTGVVRRVFAVPMRPSQLGDKNKNKNHSNNSRGSKAKPKDGHGDAAVAWHAGMRVLKVDLVLDAEAAWAFLSEMKPARRRRLRIAPADPALAVEHAHQFWGKGGQDDAAAPRIVPLWIDSPPKGAPVPGGTGFRRRVEFPPVALRRLATGPGKRHYVEVEEDAAESIARHVWDGGLAAVAFVTEVCGAVRRDDAVADALRAVLLPADGGGGDEKATPLPPLRILELGSGIGILGIGLAAAVPRLTGRRAAVLLTDLPDAAPRLLANLERVAAAERAAAGGAVEDPEGVGSTPPLAYEDLDWEDGGRGRFGARAAVGVGAQSSRPWDLVVLSDCTYNTDTLPALVATLAALHAAARRVDPAFVSHVLLFRKPRHADEAAVFGLLAQHGWAEAARSAVALPGGGGDGPGGAVEVYLYRCG